MLAARFDKSFQFKILKSGKKDGWIGGKDKLFNMKLLTMVLFKQPVASCVYFFFVFGYFGSGNRRVGEGGGRFEGEGHKHTRLGVNKNLPVQSTFTKVSIN